jgi:hypothetical protein
MQAVDQGTARGSSPCAGRLGVLAAMNRRVAASLSAKQNAKAAVAVARMQRSEIRGTETRKFREPLDIIGQMTIRGFVPRIALSLHPGYAARSAWRASGMRGFLAPLSRIALSLHPGYAARSAWRASGMRGFLAPLSRIALSLHPGYGHSWSKPPACIRFNSA